MYSQNHPSSSSQAFLPMPTFVSQQRKVGKMLLVSDGTNPPYSTQHKYLFFVSFCNFPLMTDSLCRQIDLLP